MKLKDVNRGIDDSVKYKSMSSLHNPYGDGKACERIIEFISKL